MKSEPEPAIERPSPAVTVPSTINFVQGTASPQDLNYKGMRLPTLEEIFPLAVVLIGLFIPGLTNFLLFSPKPLEIDYLHILLFSIAYTLPFYIALGILSDVYAPISKAVVQLAEAKYFSGTIFICITFYYSILIAAYLVSQFLKLPFDLFLLYAVLLGAMVLYPVAIVIASGTELLLNNIRKVLRWLFEKGKVAWHFLNVPFK